MKFLIFVLLTIVCRVNIFSQQNFINVPSGEVTKKQKFFFQQQINFNELIQSNTTMDYGLGKGFEVGLNVLGLNYSEKGKSFLKNDDNDRDPYNPLFMLNAQKAWDVNDRFTVTLGTQFGINYDFDEKKGNAGLLYSNLKMDEFLAKKGVLVAGFYYNSMHYGGLGNRFGIWAGAELPMSKKLHFLAESVFGDNAICYSSTALVYYPIPQLPLTFGLQLPNTKTNAASIVFELTIVH